MLRRRLIAGLRGTALALAFLPYASGADVYFNDFNGPRGTTYSEWTSSGYTYTANTAGTVPGGSGPETVANVDSPNGKQRFLGEFGGPVIVPAPPYDPQHFVRVSETVTLTLKNLNPHAQATVGFDLYVLKSWDGNNPNYGPDRWSLSVEGGATLLDTTFSNNPKTGAYDLSLQNYPSVNSLPQTSKASVNSLGYSFYGDSIYHLTFTFPHTAGTLVLNFSSSLFEGKGASDESWGLDNVRVSTNDEKAEAVLGFWDATTLEPVTAITSASWFGVTGQNFSPVVREWQASDFNGDALPATLGDVSVKVNGNSAAIRSVNPAQIVALAPLDTSAGTVSVQVTNPSGTAFSTINLKPFSPRVFSYTLDGGEGTQNTFVSDVAVVGKQRKLKPSDAPPAAVAGQSVDLLMSGLGPTSPAAPTDRRLPSADGDGAPIVFSVAPELFNVLVGGAVCPVTAVALVDTGIYKLTCQLPGYLLAGNLPVQVQVGGEFSQDGLVLPVVQAPAEGTAP
jgi:uncharacterized protein (TIGR03437 family)